MCSPGDGFVISGRVNWVSFPWNNHLPLILFMNLSQLKIHYPEHSVANTNKKMQCGGESTINNNNTKVIVQKREGKYREDKSKAPCPKCGRGPQGLIKDLPSCWMNRYKLCFGRAGHWLALAGHPKPGVSMAWICPATLTTTQQEFIVFSLETVVPHSLISRVFSPLHGPLQLDVKAPIPCVRSSLKCWSRCALQGCCQLKVTLQQQPGSEPLLLQRLLV